MPVELEPLATTRRSDSVAERLRMLILTGVYPAGSRLPNERHLSEALGVNRASLREALKRLEFVELIEVRTAEAPPSELDVKVRLLELSTDRSPGEVRACAVDSEIRPARGCLGSIGLPLVAEERREDELVRHYQLNRLLQERTLLVERKLRRGRGDGWTWLPSLLVVAAGDTLEVRLPAPPEHLYATTESERELEADVEIRIAPPTAQSVQTPPIALPAGAVLRGGVAVTTAHLARGAPIEFQIVANTKSGAREIFRRTVRSRLSGMPPARPATGRSGRCPCGW